MANESDDGVISGESDGGVISGESGGGMIISENDVQFQVKMVVLFPVKVMVV